MSTLIFDIETVGDDFETFDQVTQEALTRWIKREPVSEHERLLNKIKDGLGFSPLTGHIVAIGVLDDEKGKGAVYFDTNKSVVSESEKDGIKLKPMSEKEMLEHFWRVVSDYEAFVSFNGRGFDVPYLMVRSAVYGIRPTKNLMSNRYLENQDYDSHHIDLVDQLSFYGTVRRKGSLHMWCRAFGIASPKIDGVVAADIGHLYEKGRFEDVAYYNAGTLVATRALYHHWRKNMAF